MQSITPEIESMTRKLADHFESMSRDISPGIAMLNAEWMMGEIMESFRLSPLPQASVSPPDKSIDYQYDAKYLHKFY